MSVAPGQMLSHYRLAEKIGEGGMGVVWKAEDTKLRRQVALKVLPPDLVANEERRLRFLREARTAAAVNHPNIATVHEIDEADGVVFITMELVQGKTLRHLIGSRPMSIPDVLRIATAMAEGLAEAHKAHVIHRDLKPENVIVSKTGHTKILDFGLAKLHEDLDQYRRSELSKLATVSGEMTRDGKVMGTPAYMSPEQARGKPVDSRSDLFAFGITLYEMATGSLPFRGKTVTDTLSAIIRDAPLPSCELNPDVPPELERVISKCLEKDPANRYQHTDELALDLRRLKQTTDSGVQRIPTPSGPVSFQGRGRRNRSLLYGTVAVVLVVGGLVTWRYSRTDNRFHHGDRIIVADFDNETGRPELGVAMRDSVEVMLRESTLVDVIMGARFDELLARHGHSPVSRVDLDTGKRICATGGCEGIVEGRIEEEGGKINLNLAVYHSGSSDPSVSLSAGAASENDVLNMLHGMVLDSRRSLGESPDMLVGVCPPTTRSLDAYQAFATAFQSRSPDEIRRLLKTAVEIDPGFTIAYRAMSGSSWNLGLFSEARQEAAKAYEMSPELPQRCQLDIKRGYFASQCAYDAAFDAMKTYAQLYPSDSRGYSSLSMLYALAYDDMTDYVSYARQAYRLQPTEKVFQDNLSYGLLYLGDLNGIERLVSELQGMNVPESWLDVHLLNAATLRADDGLIRQIVARMRRQSPDVRMNADYALLNWLLASGRLAEIAAELPAMLRISKQLQYRKQLLWNELAQWWLANRLGEVTPGLSEMSLTLAEWDLPTLRLTAPVFVDTGVEGALPQLIEAVESQFRGDRSRYVSTSLDYLNGCLSLIRGENLRARELLEPVTRDSGLVGPHRMLGRAYERLGLLREAVQSYERALANPHLKWDTADASPVAAIPVLEQFRLAKIYEKIGDNGRARHWYERFTEDWKDADPDIPELIEAGKRLAVLRAAGPAVQ